MVHMLMQSGISHYGVELPRDYLEYQVFPSLYRRATTVGIYGELGQPRAPNLNNHFVERTATYHRWNVVSMERACLVIRHVWLSELPNGELAVYGEVEPINYTQAGMVYASNIPSLSVVPRESLDCSADGVCVVRDVITFDAVPKAA